MADNLQVDEGTGGKYAETTEVSANIHRPKVEVANTSIAGTAGTPNASVLTIQGPTAPDAAIAATPVTIGGRGSTATPTAASADNDVVHGWFDLNGRLHVVADTTPLDGAIYVDDADWTDSTSKHLLTGGLYQSSPQTVTDGDVAPYLIDANGRQIVKAAANSGVDIGDVDVLSLPAKTVAKCIAWSNYAQEFTTTQTSADLVAASGATVFYVGRLTIGTGGTTAGLVTIYYGTGAYSAGTSKCLFRGNFAPSATAYPGVVIGNGAAPFCISAASDALKITTSAGITVYVQVDYIRV